MTTPRSELRFRLPGRWFAVDLSGGPATEESIRRIAREAVGPADDRAQERATVRRELRAAVDAAAGDVVRSLMFAKEIAPGVPLPVTLAVLQPSDLRMSPAIGTSADAVLTVMAEGVKQLDPDAFATMTHVAGPGVPALRTHATSLITSEQGIEARLCADYWVPVPGSKQLLMVRFATPLGDVEHVMLALFDELVSVAYFTAAAARSLRDELTAGRR